MLTKLNLGKQGADLCSSPMTQLFVAAYFAQCDWRDYVHTLRDLYRTRRDAMLEALATHFPPEARWTEPEGGMFIWATLPDYIDTTDLLARALQTESVAFVPGRAAYLDGRGGSSMRLNFSGVDEDCDPRGDPPHRQGDPHAGGDVRHADRRPPRGAAGGAAQATAPPAPPAPLADVVELPRRERGSRPAPRHEDR